MDFTEESKVKRCQEYMEALEEERRKIQVFQRELPLSLDLINQAIENCRQQLEANNNNTDGEEEEEEEEEQTTSNEGPVLEEFIPLKRTPSSSDFKHLNKCSNNNDTKVDWMKSVQLWNQNPDPVLKQAPHEVVELPTMIRRCGNVRELIFAIYPRIDVSGTMTPNFLTERTILSARNDDVFSMNAEALNFYPGETITYLVTDKMALEDANDNRYPNEYLNSLEPSGLPPFRLELKVGLNFYPGETITYLVADKMALEDANDNRYPNEYLNSLEPSGLPPFRLELKVGCHVMLLGILLQKTVFVMELDC